MSLGTVLTGYTYVGEGDILIAKITPCFENGKGAIAYGLVNGIGFATTEVIPIRCKSSICKEFIYYLLVCPPFRSIAEGSMYGAGGQKRVSDNFVVDYVFSLPSLDEQIKIAAFLDHETAQIDLLIEKQEKLIVLLKEKRQAVISHAVTKGLDPDVEMKDSGVEWLGEVPAHWGVKRCANLFNEIDDRGFPHLPLLVVSIRTGVTVRLFTNDKIEQVAADKNSYKRATAKDIVFNKMRMWQGAVGASPIDGLVSPDYTVARLRGLDSALFFEQLLRTKGMQAEAYRYSHGIVLDRNRLYWDGFKNIRVPVPPVSEQKKVVNYLNEFCEKCEKLMAKAELAITLLNERRTALISAAVTGKIDVRGCEK